MTNEIFVYLIEKINNYFNDRKKTVIVFGSINKGTVTSDLDACIILDEIKPDDIEFLVKTLENIHNKFNLKVDQDAPYQDKSIFTYSDCQEVIQNPPFNKINNKYLINDIPDNDYLVTSDAKKRLLLNILTCKNNILVGEEYIKPYIDKAWRTLIDIIISYTNWENITINMLATSLCCNPETNKEYKDYLGYEITDIQYLREMIKKYLSN